MPKDAIFRENSRVNYLTVEPGAARPRTIVCMVCLIAIISAQVNEVAGQGSSGADCAVNGPGLSCISCSVNITVDLAVGINCKQRPLRGRSLSNVVCNSLQDVLDSIASYNTVHSPDTFDCIEIILRDGDHVISSAVEISQSVVWRGEEGRERRRRQAPQPPPQMPTGAQTQATPTASTESPTQAISSVQVTFDLALNSTSSPSTYVLSFSANSLVGMSGVAFHDSPRILGFENVSVVAIEDCSFRYFDQGAVDIFNCPNVAINNCLFSHNRATTVLKRFTFRGHSAALSVGYNYRNTTTMSSIAMVTNCTFRNNSATVIPLAFEEARFPGSGGGMALLINGITPVDVKIEGCIFRRNFARQFGAGIFTLLSGLSNHTITVNRSEFRNNVTPGTAGGLEIGFLEGGTSENTNRVLVYDCEFVGNEAQYGGGAYLFPVGLFRRRRVGEFGNSARFERCRFHRNMASEVGAAFGASLRSPLQYRETFNPVEFVDCNFTENVNSAENAGTLTTAYFPLSFHGNNLFANNNGATLTVIGAHVRVYGSLYFTRNGNMALSGGALYVTSLGQVELFPGAKMNFSNNNGVEGAALVSEPLRVVPALSQLIFNPLCTLLFSDANVPPSQWDQYNVSVSFNGNRALVASAVFLNNLQLCSWAQLSPPYFDAVNAFHWNFITFNNNTNNAHSPNATDPRWAVQTPAVQVNVINPIVVAFPGEPIELELSAYDELGEPTAVVFRLTDNSFSTLGTGPPMRMEAQSLSEATEYIRFVPSSGTLDRIEAGIVNTSFIQLSDSGPRQEVILVETVTTPKVVRNRFIAASLRCPAGNTLSMAATQGYEMCTCDQEHPDVVDCDRRMILLRNGLWGTIDLSSSPGDPLVTYPCPAGYCRCFVRTIKGPQSCDYVMDSNGFNRQCSCDREGVLCGSCRSGMGVTALFNNCVTCSDAFGTLIAALAIVDLLIYLAALTFALSVPLPPWLYPCVFYLQILPLMTDYFPTSFEKFRPYLYYVGSALGLYFPYDFCLYANMTELVSYAVRYVPFFVALLVCPVVLIIRRYKFLPVPWHGLWSIVLLLYTPLIHTSMSILNCPILPGRNGTQVPRWFVNGNINCFSGGHIPLGLLAIFILFLATLLVPLVAILSLDLIQKVRWLHHLVEPLTNAYKEKYRWWSAVELAKRLLLLVFIIALPANDYPAIYILLILLFVVGFVQPYKHWSYNMLDVVMAGNILVLLLLRNTNQVEEDFQVIPPQSQLRRMGRGGRAECGEIEGVTNMTWLLFPFSYFPLLLTLIILVVWTVYKVGGWVRMLKCSCHKREAELQRTSTLTLPQKPRTTTIVDMAELDSPISPGVDDYKQYQSPTLTTVDIKELEREPIDTNTCDSASEKFKHEDARKLLSWPFVQDSSKGASNTPPGPGSLPRTLVSIETII